MKNKALLAFTLLLICLRLSGQNYHYLDSMRAQLSKANPKQRFEILTDIGFHFRLSYPDSTLFYCQEAYTLGKSLSLETNLSRPLSFMGLASAYKGDFAKSFDYHSQAIRVAAEQKDTIQLAYGYNNFGRLFFDQGDMVRAYDQFVRARELFIKVDDPVGLAYLYRSLANLYSSQNDFVRALEMSELALEVRSAMRDPRPIISSLTELGKVHQAMKNTNASILYFKKADSLARQINDNISLAEIKLGLSELYLSIGRFDEAYNEIQESYRILAQLENKKLLTNAYLLLGRYYFEVDRSENAISYLNLAIKEAENASNKAPQRDAYFFLAKIAEKQGRQVQANEYMNKYLVLNESLQNVELTRQIERLKFQLEIEKKETENELLKVNEAKNLAMIQRQRTQNIAMAAVSLIVVVFGAITWKNSRKKRLMYHKMSVQKDEIARQREQIVLHNETLLDQNKTLEELNHEKDTLMNIVAHDLKSPLSRIRGFTEIMFLEGHLNESQKKYLMMIRDEVKAGSELIIDLLDVNNLEENKEEIIYTKVFLNSFLQEKVRTHQPSASAKNIRIKVDIKSDLEPITDPAFLSRILDNLMTNAIKFSESFTQVSLFAWQDGESVKISVKDQGPGFTPDDKAVMFQKFKRLSAMPTGGESSNGLGLAIVKILSERIGADLALHSEPGKGSEFILSIPINQERN